MACYLVRHVRRTRNVWASPDLTSLREDDQRKPLGLTSSDADEDTNPGRPFTTGMEASGLGPKSSA